MSRFTRLERPLMAPGECMVCKGYALPVVDFNVVLQAFNGKLYLCEECLHEALETINPDAFKTDQTDWKSYAEELEKKVKVLTDGINGLSDSFTDLCSRAADSVEFPAVAVNEEQSGDTKTSGKGTGKGKSASAKQGPNDVSSLNLDELLGS